MNVSNYQLLNSREDCQNPCKGRLSKARASKGPSEQVPPEVPPEQVPAVSVEPASSSSRSSRLRQPPYWMDDKGHVYAQEYVDGNVQYLGHLHGQSIVFCFFSII